LAFDFITNDLAMKNILIALLLIVSTTAFARQPQEQVDVVYSKHHNLFVFKASKKLLGARIEVLSADGNQVASQRLMKRKMIIDFCDVKSGIYTIVVSKNDLVQKYEFIRK